jgi:hypothetical protein
MSYYISFDLMIEFIYLMDEEGDSHPTSNLIQVKDNQHCCTTTLQLCRPCILCSICDPKCTTLQGRSGE